MSRNLVIFTGASSGIGRALAEACPLPEPRLVDISRRGGPGCEHVALDLAEPATWEEVAKLFEREIGGFAGDRVVFFHCAGTLTPIGFAGEVEPAAYARSILLNCAAPPVLGDAFLRAAAGTRARCDLVMIGSGAARSIYEGWTSYAAGKAGADQWVRTAGAEQVHRGGHVHLLSIAPGVVATPMQEEIRQTPERDFPQRDRFEALHREGALRDPATVAREIWGLLDRDLENGAVLDLRDAAAAAEAVR